MSQCVATGRGLRGVTDGRAGGQPKSSQIAQHEFRLDLGRIVKH